MPQAQQEPGVRAFMIHQSKEQKSGVPLHLLSGQIASEQAELSARCGVQPMRA
jgi:hypothetical protein